MTSDCNEQFAELLSAEDLHRCPQNTVNVATWAVSLFDDWRAKRHRQCVEEQNSDTVDLSKPLAAMSDEEINYTIPFFIAEIKKRDGTDFSPTSLRSIVLRLQKYLELQGRHVKLFSGVQFRSIRDTLDAVINQHAESGVITPARQAAIITKDMENTLWQKGLLGDDNPTTLLHTIIYIFGLHLALRGREEHRQLRHCPSQISLKVTNTGRRYLEYKQVYPIICVISCLYTVIFGFLCKYIFSSTFISIYYTAFVTHKTRQSQIACSPLAYNPQCVLANLYH